MADRINDLLQRWRAQKGARGQWPTHWEDLSRIMLIRRLGFISDVQPGDRRADELFDGTAMQEARRLANTVGGMIRPDGDPFFFIKTGEDGDERTDEVKDWLGRSAETLRRALYDPKARFRQATGEVDLDLTVLGTAAMFIGEIVGFGQLIFQSIHLNDAIPFFDEYGNLEGIFRSRRMPLRQAEEKWGREKLSEASQKKLNEGEKNGDEKVEFLFVTTKRKEGRPDAVLARNLPFAEIVIEVEAKHEVMQGGFHELPYIVPRWDTSSGEDYGRSPGMIALPDANTSQAIGETMLVAGQRAADPPLLAPSDSFISAPNTWPGGMANYEAEAVRDLGSNPIKYLESAGNFPLTRDIQQDTRDQIRNAFMRDQFKLPAPGEATMTATEVTARLQEFVREMGAVFGRFETDYTAPMIERAFRIMLRAGQFGEIPEAIQGRSVRFEYESPIKRIRQQARAIAGTTWLAELRIHAAETGDPSVLDVANADEIARGSAEANNLPEEWVNGADMVAALREQRAAEQEEAQVMAGLQQMAAMAKDAGGAVKAAGMTGEANGG